MSRIYLCAAIVVLSMGCPSEQEATIHIDLVTDLVPNVEFEALRLQVGDGELAERFDHLADVEANYVRAVRLDTISAPAAGTRLTVILFRAGSAVAEKQVLVESVGTSRSITISISRDCRGVECPASGNPTLDSCLGGRCVDPRCTPQTPEFCPPPECLTHADCADSVADCASPYCSSGVCFAATDNALCNAGQFCDGLVGCRPVPGSSDAGSFDAGPADSAIDGSDLAIPDSASPDAPALASVSPIFPWNGYVTGSFHAADGSLVAHPLQPEFRWRPVADASYQIQLTRGCSVSGFRGCAFDPVAGGVVDETVTAPIFRPSLPLEVDLQGSRYFWRVRACMEAACSAWSEVRYLDVGRDDHDYNGNGYADHAVGDPEIDAEDGLVEIHNQTDLGVDSVSRLNSSDLTTPDYSDTVPASFGSSVAAVGDVDADGFADLMVGARYSAHLYLGGWRGIDRVPGQSLVMGLEGASGVEVRAAGDVDGDGYADVLMFKNTGDALLFRGTSTGLSEEFVLLVVADSVEEASAGGDVNGDGYADVWVSTRGNTYLFLGSALGISVTADLVLTEGGSASGAGDINADGYADVIVGNKFANDRAGEAYVFFGGPEGPSRLPDQTIVNPAEGEFFGNAVAGVGDLNADGVSDVVIAATGPANGVGSVFVYLGNPATGLPPSPSLAIRNPQVGRGFFGSDVRAAGDVDRDGFADFTVSAPSQNGVYIFLGDRTTIDAHPGVTLEALAGRRFGGAFAWSLPRMMSVPG